MNGEILIVDDDPESLALLSRILTEEGYKARAADGSRLALAAMESMVPDLVLLDMRLPEMDGLELLRRLKEHKDTAEVPVIFISGSSDLGDRVEGLRLGAVDFVTKPFQREELLARLRTHLELSRFRLHLADQVAQQTDQLLQTVQLLEKEIGERRRTEQALRESEARLRALSASLISVQEDERRRISRELHDDLIQRLAMIAIDLGKLTVQSGAIVPCVKAELRSLQERAVETAALTRHIAHELHPLILDDLGIVAAVRSLCEEYARREEIQIDFSNGVLPEVIERETASCIYAVVQEALLNISKHAQAKNAAVNLAHQTSSIALTVVDDGVGLSQAVLDGGIGLGMMNMRERVRWANGTFRIESQPGQGVRITAHLPATQNNVQARTASTG